MRRVSMCVGICAVLLASVAFAQESRADWATMHEDVTVMEQLVGDTVRKAVREYKRDAVKAHMEEGAFPEDMILAHMERGMDYEVALVTVLEGSIDMPSESVGLAALYLPGYGAIFAGRVQFALSAPPPPPPTPAPEKAARWDEYRRRVLGTRRTPSAKREERPYDEKLVVKVKEAIVELLATEAKNFRVLPEGERVTIFLYAPMSTGTRARQAYVAKSWGINEVSGSVVAGGLSGARRSVVTASVKGSDLAAQREGKLTSEEVKKKIEITQR